MPQLPSDGFFGGAELIQKWKSCCKTSGEARLADIQDIDKIDSPLVGSCLIQKDVQLCNMYIAVLFPIHLLVMIHILIQLWFRFSIKKNRLWARSPLAIFCWLCKLSSISVSPHQIEIEVTTEI